MSLRFRSVAFCGPLKALGSSLWIALPVMIRLLASRGIAVADAQRGGHDATHADTHSIAQTSVSGIILAPDRAQSKCTCFTGAQQKHLISDIWGGGGGGRRVCECVCVWCVHSVYIYIYIYIYIKYSYPFIFSHFVMLLPYVKLPPPPPSKLHFWLSKKNRFLTSLQMY